MHWFKRKRRTSVILSDSTHNRMSNHVVDIPRSEYGESIDEKRNCCQKCCTNENLKEQALLIATIISVILGVIVGIALREIKCPTGKKNK